MCAWCLGARATPPTLGKLQRRTTDALANLRPSLSQYMRARRYQYLSTNTWKILQGKGQTTMARITYEPLTSKAYGG